MKKHILTVAAAAGIMFTSFGGSVSAHENHYTVKSGDTLWKISQANKLSVSDLKSWNGLTSDIIYVNQNLSLLAPHTHETASSSTYTVQRGDTLWGISSRNNLTVAHLKSLNNLSSDMIYVGQVLVVSGTTATHAPISTVSKAQLVIAEAKKYIGTPYLWGGNTPAGFDCSGFSKYVFEKAGISIPRTAATQWSGLKAVGSPSPGDLVFFETYAPGPTHLGIYMGDNKFIHAGTSTGVTITDMNNPYWEPRYLGAKTAF
ncbi:C40 family peptidase [Bacillus sp. OK048]|uniref:C40 family peptidase n=1 Tax=Bacillus sp. OK048 TaxID=1882761 RepID=UPI00087E4447|nr:C40 family peptidase [Bacillus sp. OK048]SDM39703.1 peptidoglycan endopeptidase LytE [Bacillus sp. OK048]